MSWSPWRKSSRSGQTSDCVEVAWRGTERTLTAGVRDSKNQDGPNLAVPMTAFTAFVRSVGEQGE